MPQPATYEVRIDLKDADPPIWRTVVVPADIELHHLHNVIQVAMGWTNSHLHEFRKGKTCYGVPSFDGEDFGKKIRPECEYALADLLTKPKQKIIYSYDFGDCWEHAITLLAIHPDECTTIRCLAGERAGPPEDCGGVGGYVDLLAVIADPTDEEHEDLLSWFKSMTPKGHDPAVFPIDRVNNELALGLDHLAKTIWADEEEWNWAAGKLRYLQFSEPMAIPYDLRKVTGQNDPCPCGSGQKFKKCCGK